MVPAAGPLSDGMPFLFFGVYVPLEFFSAQTPLVIYRHNPFSSRGCWLAGSLANFSYFTFNKEFGDHLRRVFNVLTTVVEILFSYHIESSLFFSRFLSLMLRVVFLSFVRLFLLLVLLLFLPLTQVRS